MSPLQPVRWRASFRYEKKGRSREEIAIESGEGWRGRGEEEGSEGERVCIKCKL